MQKNDTVTVKIEDMGVGGEGIGKIDGYTLFVKDTVIGDVAEVSIMKAKKNYGYARMTKLVTPSAERVKPVCPVARQCGGCQLQAMSYQEQLRFKEKKVKNNLERLGGFSPELVEAVFDSICGMNEPFRYRNKAQFPIGTDKEGNPVAGFYAGHTHQIIPHTDCVLGVRENEAVLQLILKFMKDNHIPAYDEKTQKGLIRHVLIRYGFTTKEIMVCLVINGKKIPGEELLAKMLMGILGMKSVSVSVNKENTNVIMGRQIRVLQGQGYITDYIGPVEYQISPLSFYQVNPVQTEKLYAYALEYAGLTGEETVWDLYCGIGTISLFLAQKAKKVYGVEIILQAIEDAKANAVRNGFENTEFFVGKAEEILPEYYAEYERKYGRRASADVIVVDPPRKGCEQSLLETMVKMQPERIIYVSCDSATLARDLKYLCGNGYEMKRGRAVDQFPMGVHVETVCLLSNRKSKPDSHVELSLDMDDYYRIKDGEK